jgi:hypothetical protein
MRAKKRAAFSLFRAGTIVWSSWMGKVTSGRETSGIYKLK